MRVLSELKINETLINILFLGNAFLAVVTFFAFPIYYRLEHTPAHGVLVFNVTIAGFFVDAIVMALVLISKKVYWLWGMFMTSAVIFLVRVAVILSQDLDAHFLWLFLSVIVDDVLVLAFYGWRKLHDQRISIWKIVQIRLLRKNPLEMQKELSMTVESYLFGKKEVLSDYFIEQTAISETICYLNAKGHIVELLIKNADFEYAVIARLKELGVQVVLVANTPKNTVIK